MTYDLMVTSIVSLSGLGALSAGILFLVAKKFTVYEDPKIDEVEGALPGANCGGCGFAGCRNFAETLVKTKDMDKHNCPVNSMEGNEKIASILGIQVVLKEPKLAVLKCQGTLANAPKKMDYLGAQSCQLAHNLYAGESGCSYGCLGLGDCVKVCNFDALFTDPVLGIPVVVEAQCTACGACVEGCPRDLFELMPRGKNRQRVYVACMNTEKGGVAKKNCSVACIGCSKCSKVSDPNLVKITNFLSYIDPKIDVEKHGHALVDCCPTHAIVGVNLPPKPIEVKKEEEEVKIETPVAAKES